MATSLKHSDHRCTTRCIHQYARMNYRSGNKRWLGTIGSQTITITTLMINTNDRYMLKDQSHEEFADDSFLCLFRCRLAVVFHVCLYQRVRRKCGKQTKLSSHGSSRDDCGQFTRIITRNICTALNTNCLQACSLRR